MTDDPDDLTPEDMDNPFVQHLLFNELFKQVSECDSKRVDDFWAEMDESVVYLVNLEGKG